MNKESILEKARKLKALAGSSNPHESKLALLRMQAILAKHGLEEIDMEKDEFGRLCFEYNGQPWARYIIGGLAYLYFCKIVYQPTRNGKALYSVIGSDTNTQVVKELALPICDKVHYEARQQGFTSSEITSFRTGASMQIAINAGELVQNAKKVGGIECDAWGDIGDGTGGGNAGCAVVIGDYYETNGQKIDEWMKDNMGRIKPGVTRRSKVDFASYEKGKLYGDTIELQKKIEKN